MTDHGTPRCDERQQAATNSRATACRTEQVGASHLPKDPGQKVDHADHRGRLASSLRAIEPVSALIRAIAGLMTCRFT